MLDEKVGRNTDLLLENHRYVYDLVGITNREKYGWLVRQYKYCHVALCVKLHCIDRWKGVSVITLIVSCSF